MEDTKLLNQRQNYRYNVIVNIIVIIILIIFLYLIYPIARDGLINRPIYTDGTTSSLGLLDIYMCFIVIIIILGIIFSLFGIIYNNMIGGVFLIGAVILYMIPFLLWICVAATS